MELLLGWITLLFSLWCGEYVVDNNQRVYDAIRGKTGENTDGSRAPVHRQ